MSEDKPKIEFPCDYPIKVMGEATPDFKVFVIETVRRHAPDLDTARVSVQASRGNRYYSVTLHIRATGGDQLALIFDELRSSGRVRLVL